MRIWWVHYSFRGKVIFEPHNSFYTSMQSNSHMRWWFNESFLRFNLKVLFKLQYFKQNPDYHNPQYNTKYGIYSEGCGLNKITMSWGHDEYMYIVSMIFSFIFMWVVRLLIDTDNLTCLVPNYIEFKIAIVGRFCSYKINNIFQFQCSICLHSYVGLSRLLRRTRLNCLQLLSS